MPPRYFSMVVAKKIKRNGSVCCGISDGHKIRRIAGLVHHLDKALLAPDADRDFMCVDVNKHDHRPVTVRAHREAVEEVIELANVR